MFQSDTPRLIERRGFLFAAGAALAGLPGIWRSLQNGSPFTRSLRRRWDHLSRSQSLADLPTMANGREPLLSLSIREE